MSQSRRAKTIDHDPAEKPSQGPAPAAPQPQSAVGAADDDPPMDTAENLPNFVFKPKAGITTLDAMEIMLLYYLEISGNTIPLPKGGLRHIAISGTRLGCLSDQAAQYMVPVVAPTPDAPQDQGK